MNKFFVIPIAIFSAAGAQILMKLAVNHLQTDQISLIYLMKSWQIYASVILYGFTFILTAYLFSVFELSFISPVLVGGVMLVIFIAGISLGESVTLLRVIGGGFLVSGIVLLAYSQ